MGEQGFLCTWVDTAYGGQAKDFLYSVIVCEEMARTNQGGLCFFSAQRHRGALHRYIRHP